MNVLAAAVLLALAASALGTLYIPDQTISPQGDLYAVHGHIYQTFTAGSYAASSALMISSLLQGIPAI